MILTPEQVLALAPDAASAAAARKLAHPRDWHGLGRSDHALWGECQGSARYQVRVHLPDAAVKCSCPSRKFPCKHGLALMLIAAGQPELVPDAAAPSWVADWLTGRARTIEGRDQKPKKTTPPDPEAQARRAGGRLDALDPPLQADVRQLVGWNLKEDEVVAAGDLVEDDWLVLGQFVDDDERFRIQRTWLKGLRSGRVAMILQFAAGMAPFGETFAPATHFEATLAFWPSAFPLRALVHARQAVAVPWHDRLPGADRFASCLDDAAAALGRLPWLGRHLCVVCDVVPVVGPEERWSLVDRDRAALPLAGTGTWSLLALSGGNPIDVAAEWDGRVLRPLFAASWPEHLTWSRPAT